MIDSSSGEELISEISLLKSRVADLEKRLSAVHLENKRLRAKRNDDKK